MSEPDAGSDVAGIRTRAERDGDELGRQRAEDLDLRRRRRRLVLPRSPAPTPTPARTRACPSSSSTCARPGVIGQADPRHDRQPPLLRGVLRRTSGCRPTTWSASSTAASARSCGRWSTSGAASTASCPTARSTTTCRPLADTRRPAGAPGDRRARDRLPHRPAARAARDAGPGAAAVLGRHQDVLHRVRAARRRRSAAASLGPARHARRAGPRPTGSRRNICYAPGYTIMGGTTQILRNILGERTLGLPREPAGLADGRARTRRYRRQTGGGRCGEASARVASTMAAPLGGDDDRVELEARRSRGPPPPARRTRSSRSARCARPASSSSGGERRGRSTRRAASRSVSGRTCAGAAATRGRPRRPGPSVSTGPDERVVGHATATSTPGRAIGCTTIGQAAGPSAPPCGPSVARSSASSWRSRARPPASVLASRRAPGVLTATG